MDIRSLSNSELKEQLLKRGVNPGPILPSTRSVYEKKLQQLLEKVQVQENGDAHEDQYSDSDDEGTPFKDLVGLRNELNGDGEDSVKNHSYTNPKNTASEDFPEMLSQAALGMSATRRKPIKGAAGRPIQFQYDDLVIRAKMKEQAKQREITEEKKQQRLVSVPLQIVIFVLVAFTVLVLLSMESSPENPFEHTTGDAKLKLP